MSIPIVALRKTFIAWVNQDNIKRVKEDTAISMPLYCHIRFTSITIDGYNENSSTIHGNSFYPSKNVFKCLEQNKIISA